MNITIVGRARSSGTNRRIIKLKASTPYNIPIISDMTNFILSNVNSMSCNTGLYTLELDKDYL